MDCLSSVYLVSVVRICPRTLCVVIGVRPQAALSCPFSLTFFLRPQAPALFVRFHFHSSLSPLPNRTLPLHSLHCTPLFARTRRYEHADGTTDEGRTGPPVPQRQTDRHRRAVAALCPRADQIRSGRRGDVDARADRCAGRWQGRGAQRSTGRIGSDCRCVACDRSSVAVTVAVRLPIRSRPLRADRHSPTVSKSARAPRDTSTPAPISCATTPTGVTAAAHWDSEGAVTRPLRRTAAAAGSAALGGPVNRLARKD